MSEEQGIPPDEIIEAAHAAGFTVSKEQLRRWRDRGLIPRPTKIGLGRGEGTTSFYPRDTEKQVIALCRILKQDRRLDLAAISLFFQGYQIRFSSLQEILLKNALQMKKYSEGKVDENGLTDKGWQEIDQLASKNKIRPQSLKNIRSRLRPSRFTTFIRVMLFILSGKVPDIFKDSLELDLDTEILRTGIGIQNTLSAQIGRAGKQLKEQFKTWIDLNDEELRDSVSEFVRYLNPNSMWLVLQSSTLGDLEMARDEVLAIWKSINSFSNIIEKLFRKDLFGLKPLLEIDLQNPNPLVPMLLMGWLSMRRLPDFDEKITELTSTQTMATQLEMGLSLYPEILDPVKRELTANLFE